VIAKSRLVEVAVFGTRVKANKSDRIE
jgi:hypothetical protein